MPRTAASAIWTASLPAGAVGSAPPGIDLWQIDPEAAGPPVVQSQRRIAREKPFFLALHPRLPILYATHFDEDGGVDVIPQDGRDPQRIESTGDSPCHLMVSPAGDWMYVANYGDGTVVALELDDGGLATGQRVTLPFTGSSIHARQEASHPHATTISPDGGFLVIADLGADALRAHRLHAGRPSHAPMISALPAGTGPRHLAWREHSLYVTGELDGRLHALSWDERTGRAEVRASVAATAAPPEETHFLSDLLVHDGRIIVASRGRDTLAVIEDDAEVLTLRGEVDTFAWPTQITLWQGHLLVAATRADRIAAHELGSDGALGSARAVIEAPAPMAVLSDP